MTSAAFAPRLGAPSLADGIALLREAVRSVAAAAANGAAVDAAAVDAAPVPEQRPADPTDGGPPPPPPPPPDAEQSAVMSVVARAQAGDAEAFGELYDRYVDLVFRYIYYRVGAKPLAEDLTSETFLRALRRITSFSWQGRDFGAWLVTIARNLVADHYKSGRYRLEVATGDLLDGDTDTRSVDGPEGLVLDALTNEALLAAVRELSSEQQECIVLRFLQGLSVSETAAAMGKNDGAIKALQYRAVRSLARLLPGDFR